MADVAGFEASPAASRMTKVTGSAIAREVFYKPVPNRKLWPWSPRGVRPRMGPKGAGWPGGASSLWGLTGVCHDETLMRSIGATAVTTILVLLAGPTSCGLDSQGLLATDGGTDASTEPSEDASGAAPADDVGPPDAESSGDAAAVPRRDASATAALDSSPAPVKDASTDALTTCSGCIDPMCSAQVAACGAGSDCLAYRDCNVTCSSKGGQGTSNCSSVCQSKYPAGEIAFASLTLCALRCGAGCAAGLTVGAP
jgi:hypothetical protein